jgi:hypothetical protein
MSSRSKLRWSNFEDREMSAPGPSRRFAAAQQFSCFGAKRTFSEPRIENRIYEYAPLVSSGIAEDEARPSTSTDLTA